MIEVFPMLFVGNANDLIHPVLPDGSVALGWYVISAAKEPWHREALGYTGRGAPKEHEEYLLARRERRLNCNLIDIDNPEYIRVEIVEAVIEAIDEALNMGDKVLIHCNQGQSRAPMLALLWMRWTGFAKLPRAVMSLLTVDQAMEAMKQVYPLFAPSKGMEGFARAHWEAMADNDKWAAAHYEHDLKPKE